MTRGADLEFRDVRFGYPGSGEMTFNFGVEAGGIVALMGPSGSGKSTLLALIAGFETPLSGSIVIGGRDVTRLPPASRPVSMVFQENNLFAHLDVESNVGLGLSPSLRLGREERQRIEEALASTGLAGKTKRLPAELSGGMAIALGVPCCATGLCCCSTNPSHRSARRCGSTCWRCSPTCTSAAA